MFFAFYDNFPIITNDTGTYIGSGMDWYVPSDRPVFYGIFLKITSLGVSLWLPVFVQCLILAYVLICFLKKIIPDISQIHMIGIFILISLTTICGWYSSQLMPDIFTGILALSLLIYFLFENDITTTIILLCITFLAIVVHNSHYIIATLVSILGLIISFFNKYRYLFKKSLIVLSMTLVGWLLLMSSNAYSGKGFVASPSSHVFLMGKLAESGVLKTYLDKACPVKSYKICNYKDNLPPVAWAFVWDANSPLYLTGGWDSNKHEYQTIIKDIVSRPKYIPFLVYKSLEATARQLSLINIDDFYLNDNFVFDASTPPYQQIAEHFPHELNEFISSKQNWKSFNIRFYNVSFALVLIISSLIIIFFLPDHFRKQAQAVYCFIIVYLILNAFVSASFANVLTRLSSRVIWLLPTMNIVFVYKTVQLYNGKKKDLNSSRTSTAS